MGCAEQHDHAGEGVSALTTTRAVDYWQWRWTSGASVRAASPAHAGETAYEMLGTYMLPINFYFNRKRSVINS